MMYPKEWLAKPATANVLELEGERWFLFMPNENPFGDGGVEMPKEAAFAAKGALDAWCVRHGITRADGVGAWPSEVSS